MNTELEMKFELEQIHLYIKTADSGGGMRYMNP